MNRFALTLNGICFDQKTFQPMVTKYYPFSITGKPLEKLY